MPDDLYNPATHQPRNSPRGSSGVGTGLKKLFWYLLALLLGLGGVRMVFAFLGAIGSGQFENAKPGQQGEIFGGFLGAIIVVFLAFKCLAKGREAGL
ncbi:MAG: hypothetical protein AAF657_24615 [Acidobacteriota bacterium]